MFSKLIISAFVTLFSTTVFAQSLCDRYVNDSRYMKAIETVATHQSYSLEQFCYLPHVGDLEVQPSREIDPKKGEVIPHVRVTLHSAEYSCMYMVRDADLAITSSRCYSTF